MRHLLGIRDLGATLDWPSMADRLSPLEHPPVVGTAFLTPSMRTRVGFQVAASRMGGSAVSVSELRVDADMSGAESFQDALRVLTGMVDVLVIRTPFGLTRKLVDTYAVCPVVSGGDKHEHPTQALIDVAAIEKFAGPLEDQHVAICGDLRMRATASLLMLFEARPPKRLTLTSPESRSVDVPDALANRCSYLAPSEVVDADVLLMSGLAPKGGDEFLDDAARAPYKATREMLDRQSPSVILLSPMPVIDEVDDEVRCDPRTRFYEQSDLAMSVRIAVLNWVLRVA